ncbi:MGMT family protein [Legionella parisiensis]|uniref:DNA base-flipping protein n=1 Tax=Legionella parisiensis TaxID=45071 RepID=A0A1E5JWX2_9GAMM|nr:MGMT family protein [Legionella parisiensis]KTD41781.1 Methylated-DNA--protein-cysteine methyltransferase [Legionella parisiensis]OEH48873.1 DNA base-flipping protein [Legionella parisiensis]STX75895.1 Methylated-DNA--protein-cysteine methyltransferase [Legionella parisiensis]
MMIQTEFSKEVLRLIRSIPQGRVVTYGDIARLAGHSRGARGVGWILHSCTMSHNLPWHRVLKSGGVLSFPAGSPHYLQQRALLEKESIVITNNRVDLKKYSWNGQS